MFNLRIPTKCAGVDPKVLDPANTWDSKKDFKATLAVLANKFNKNFARYAKDTGKEVIAAGPKL